MPLNPSLRIQPNNLNRNLAEQPRAALAARIEWRDALVGAPLFGDPALQRGGPDGDGAVLGLHAAAERGAQAAVGGDAQGLPGVRDQRCVFEGAHQRGRDHVVENPGVVGLVAEFVGGLSCWPADGFLRDGGGSRVGRMI